MHTVRTTQEPSQPIPTFEETIELFMLVSFQSREQSYCRHIYDNADTAT